VAFLCPTVWQQELLSSQVEARGGSWVHAPLGDALGAFHAAEVPYVFGTTTLGDAADEALSAAMRDAWRSMADPEPAIDGVGPWPTVADGWVELDPDGIAVVGPPGAGRCALFEGSRADPYPR
jgi:carboxylesterase type B